MNAALLSFTLIMAAFLSLGVLSARFGRSTPEDYLLAGRATSPWVTALSSAATNNSGFMFVGLVGFTYRDGLNTIWMAVAWVLGDLLVWLFVHQRVREVSGGLRVNSVPALLGADPRGTQRPVVAVAGALTLVFLGGYAGAQLAAGGTALRTLFGWPQEAGILLGGVIVVVYCISGGLRASLWTDVAQSVVMLGSMLLLLLAAVAVVGGPVELYRGLRAIDPALVSIWPADLALGFPLYLLGFVAGGLGAAGAPHILVRSMAIRSAEEIPAARRLYFAWFVPFYAAAVLVALYARVMIPGLASAEGAVAATEGALPALAQWLLPDVLVGVMLAGLFSATMSTADSQILSCSAAVTQDLAPRWGDSTLASKLATLGVTVLAVAIALLQDRGVFALVLSAWGVLGASLGPLLVLRVLRVHLPTAVALAMMAVGAVVVMAWEAGPWSGDVYALLPGIVASLAVPVSWRLTPRRAPRTPAPPRA